MCDVKDLLTEASKSEPGPGCRERGIVGNRGSSVPGQPCRTHVWVSRHRAASVRPDQGLCFFSPRALNSCWQTNLRLPSQSLLLFLSLSLFQKIVWPDGEDPVLFCSPSLFGIGVCVFPSTDLCYFSTLKLLLPRSGFTIFYLTTFIFTLLPSSCLPTSDVFLSPPFIPLLKEHLWPHNEGRRGGEEEFASLGLHLDAQKGRSCCEELLFGMSAALCSNVPVYHHCDYVRWLGWPLHHGRLKCGPRVPLDEILALNPIYEHCVPREGFSLSSSLALSPFFSPSPILLKGFTRLTIHSVFYSFSLWFFAPVQCGTGNSKAPVSSSSTLCYRAVQRSRHQVKMLFSFTKISQNVKWKEAKYIWMCVYSSQFSVCSVHVNVWNCVAVVKF